MSLLIVSSIFPVQSRPQGDVCSDCCLSFWSECISQCQPMSACYECSLEYSTCTTECPISCLKWIIHKNFMSRIFVWLWDVSGNVDLYSWYLLPRISCAWDVGRWQSAINDYIHYIKNTRLFSIEIFRFKRQSRVTFCICQDYGLK